MAQAKAKEAEIQDKQDVVDDGRSTMYQNPYRKDLDKEVEDPRQAVEDTKEEATPQQTGFINNETQPNHDYKKRYDDLKSHYDRKQNENRQKVEELEAKARLAEKDKAMAGYTPPKSDKDLEQFKNEIIPFLENEIISRYYFQKGRAVQSFKNDLELKEATRILSNSKEYNNILSKEL